MKVCRVLGPVVSTIKHPCYSGLKLLSVQPVEPDGETAVGASFLAVDRVQAGEGDLVLVMSEGGGVRKLMGQEILPIRSLIVGVVDAIELATQGSGA